MNPEVRVIFVTSSFNTQAAHERRESHTAQETYRSPHSQQNAEYALWHALRIRIAHCDGIETQYCHVEARETNPGIAHFVAKVNSPTCHESTKALGEKASVGTLNANHLYKYN